MLKPNEIISEDLRWYINFLPTTYRFWEKITSLYLDGIFLVLFSMKLYQKAKY